MTKLKVFEVYTGEKITNVTLNVNLPITERQIASHFEIIDGIACFFIGNNLTCVYKDFDKVLFAGFEEDESDE